MASTSVLASETANSAAESSLGRNTSIIRPIAVIIAAARALWSNKVAVELADRTGVSVRTAENYLAGDRSMNGNALVKLLQSDVGPAFLEAIIAELPPSRQKVWRKQFERAAERAAIRRRLAELEGGGDD